ncbi:MAG TPA: hypothetical protein VF411_05440 [Bacteroidia bacterium]
MFKYLLLLSFPFMVCAQTKLQFVKRISSFKHPESVCIINADKILIADIGKSFKTTARDSDGVVYQCSINNINAKNKFNKTFKLNAPKGMAFSGSKLFIADIDRIVLADMETGIKIDEIVFADTTVSLNDVFLLDDNTLLVTVINKHELYAITLNSKEIINLSNSPIEGANGLCKYEKNMYVCGFSSKEKGKGNLYEYDLETNKITPIIKDLGHLDGIKLYNKSLLVSDWGADYNHGKIWEIDITTKKARLAYENEELKSPSGFDVLDDMLLVPCLDSGTILVYKLTQDK